jgi:hypothetical protein
MNCEGEVNQSERMNFDLEVNQGNRMKYKIGQKVEIIKYKVHFHGIIVKIDSILSANMKRAIGYWFIIEHCETVEYYCVKGETSLYMKDDICPMERTSESS